ncbi:MAG: site-specific integrase [Bryobacteraceae bacterium]
MWVLLYRDGDTRKYATLGQYSKMSKSEAQAKRDELIAEANARNATAPDPHITFGVFLEGTALPFLRSKWKRSTAATTENRIQHHLGREFGERRLTDLGLKELQAFLRAKAETLSRSVVAHLRWDLSSVFRLALAEGYTDRDPTAALFTPREAAPSPSPSMSKEEVEHYINALDLRERVIALLAIFVGLRPGEILALKRRHVSGDCCKARIEQRLYRGDIDTPKTTNSTRTVAIPPKTAKCLREWMELVPDNPEAWVFASENPATPMWRDNVWCRHMKPRLETVGLSWATFQVLRRTHASLGHDAGIDPKVAADQRGHGIGVAIDVYTKAALSRRAEAAEQLEKAVLTA